VSKFIELLTSLLKLGIPTEQAVTVATNTVASTPLQTAVLTQPAAQPVVGNGLPPTEASVGAELTERKRRRYRGRKFYAVTDAALQAAAGVGPLVNVMRDKVVPSWAATLAAVDAQNRAGKFPTARGLETLVAGGQKRKTVESSLHNLRHLGFVVSFERDDEAALAMHTARFAPKPVQTVKAAARKAVKKHRKAAKK
jgi:hypothetical protein